MQGQCSWALHSPSTMSSLYVYSSTCNSRVLWMQLYWICNDVNRLWVVLKHPCYCTCDCHIWDGGGRKQLSTWCEGVSFTPCSLSPCLCLCPVGGAPSPVTVTGGLSSTGVSGCVQNVLLGPANALDPLQLSLATSGRRTATCPASS